MSDNSIDKYKLELLEKALCEEDFFSFFKFSWHTYEPNTQLKTNWSTEAISEHLQWLAEGQIPGNRLQILVPPRTSKSSLASIAFPAWFWIKNPSAKILGTAYNLDQSREALSKFSTLVRSDWYRNYWGDKIHIVKNNVDRIKNSEQGERSALAVKGGTTGKTGNLNICDDLISINDADSVASVNKAVKYFVNTFLNRGTELTEDSKDMLIVINQRVGPNDVSAHILESDLKFTTLCLPMEFVPEKKCCTVMGFCDPRTKRGELLFQERFEQNKLGELKSSMIGNQWATQYQQDPEDTDQNLLEWEWFKPFVPTTRPKYIKKVRAWDLAGGDGYLNNDYTVGTLLGLSEDNKLYIEDIVRFKSNPIDRKQLMMEVAKKDGIDTIICIPQDPGQAGQEQAMNYEKDFKKFTKHKIYIKAARGAKKSRVNSFGLHCKENGVFYKYGEAWNDPLEDEISKFPYSKHDDIIDTLGDGYEVLFDKLETKKMKKVIFRF